MNPLDQAEWRERAIGHVAKALSDMLGLAPDAMRGYAETAVDILYIEEVPSDREFPLFRIHAAEEST